MIHLSFRSLILAISLIFALVLQPAIGQVMQVGDPVDVFVNQEEGYAMYRIPALWYSSGGVFLAFAEGRTSISDHASNDIVLKRSLDDGVTWEPLQIVASDGDNSLNNPLVVEIRETGRILLVYQRYPHGYHEREVGPGYTSDTVCRAFLVHSDDSGLSWSEPREITRQVKRPTWATSIAGGPGNGIQIRSGLYAGRVILPFNQGPFGKWTVYAAFSDDLGDNWSYGDIAYAADPGMGNEVQMVELSDGSLQLNARTAGGEKLRKTAISVDGGENWTELKNEPQLVDPHCMASIISLQGTRLSVAPLLFANPRSDQKREKGTLSLSWDDGKTWSDHLEVYPDGFAYSSLADKGEGAFGLLFEKDDYQTIAFLKGQVNTTERN